VSRDVAGGVAVVVAAAEAVSGCDIVVLRAGAVVEAFVVLLSFVTLLHANHTNQITSMDPWKTHPASVQVANKASKQSRKWPYTSI
jgi:hypothetical protein